MYSAQRAQERATVVAWRLAISGHIVFKNNHGEVLWGRVVMETAHLVTNCGSEGILAQAATALS